MRATIRSLDRPIFTSPAADTTYVNPGTAQQPGNAMTATQVASAVCTATARRARPMTPSGAKAAGRPRAGGDRDSSAHDPRAGRPLADLAALRLPCRARDGLSRTVSYWRHRQHRRALHRRANQKRRSVTPSACSITRRRGDGSPPRGTRADRVANVRAGPAGAGFSPSGLRSDSSGPVQAWVVIAAPGTDGRGVRSSSCSPRDRAPGSPPGSLDRLPGRAPWCRRSAATGHGGCSAGNGWRSRHP